MNSRTQVNYSSRLLDNETDFEIVLKVADGDEALKAIPDNRPDLVVIDVNMRRINGFSLTRQLLKYVSDLKVVIVSDSDSPNFVTLAKDIGAAAFLPKEQFSAKALRDVMFVS